MSTTTPVVDADLVTGLGDFFGDRSTPEVVAEAERDGMPRALWQHAVELGLPYVGIPEEAGGSGGTLLDTATVLRIAGGHSAPLPLLEAHLAGWLLASAGLHLPAGSECPAIAYAGAEVDVEDGRLHGHLRDVAFARDADLVVVVLPGDDSARIAVVRPTASGIRRGHDLAGQARDEVELTGEETTEVATLPFTTREVRLRATLLRAALIAGGLDAASTLTQEFTRQREQFGKPIGTFQAVQAHLVTLAQSAATVGLSVERASIAAAEQEASFEICAAKLVANAAARDSARAAHQAHGAIGMTQEYPLHQITRRLHAWRSQDGTSPELEGRIGAMLVGQPSISRLLLDDSAPEV